MIEPLPKKSFFGKITDFRETDAVEDRSVRHDEPTKKTPAFSAKGLDAVVIESIDTVLNQLLAKKATEAIYDYLERNYSLARDDLARNTEKLFAVLKELFGDKGSRVASRCIAKRIFEELGLEFTPVPGYAFSDYVETARTRTRTGLTEKRE